jgi:hypothetical protein
MFCCRTKFRLNARPVRCKRAVNEPASNNQSSQIGATPAGIFSDQFACQIAAISTSLNQTPVLPQSHQGGHHNKFCSQISSGKATAAKTPLTVRAKSTINPDSAINNVADYFLYPPAL